MTSIIGPGQPTARRLDQDQGCGKSGRKAQGVRVLPAVNMAHSARPAGARRRLVEVQRSLAASPAFVSEGHI